MHKRFIYIVLFTLLCSCLGLTACGKTEDKQVDTGTVEADNNSAKEQTTDKDSEATIEKQADKSKLTGYLNLAKNYDTTPYANPEVLEASIKNAEDLIADAAASQDEVDAALAGLKEAMTMLHDGSGFRNISPLVTYEDLPDPYVFLDGRKVETTEDWEARSDEISRMYEYYMYGMFRDGSDEILSYQYQNKSLNITVEREGRSAGFKVTVNVPDESKVAMPEGGWPVIVCFHPIQPEQYAVDHGYAVITLNTYEIASDDNSRMGSFYQLYPYGDNWDEQTGVLLAWSWGASKVLDALEQGLGNELNINPVNSIITGVSRWGKATAVCGAFDKRFKLVAPSCSGAGGLAIYRYQSEGKTYDFSTKGASSAYTYTKNEPLSSLQASGEKGWFNDKFCEIGKVTSMPLDQHLLAALCADENRYMFIIGSCISEDWVNAPSMWLCYKAANSIYKFLGLEDHLIVNIHKEGHAVIQEDMEYLIDYFNYHVYGIEPTLDLSSLKTSVFEEEANYDPLFDKFNATWIR